MNANSTTKYYVLQNSAEKCLYCKIILNGVEASGFDKGLKSFSHSNYRTFCLTPNTLLASSGIERRLEYYIAAADSAKHKTKNHRSEISW